MVDPEVLRGHLRKLLESESRNASELIHKDILDLFAEKKRGIAQDWLAPFNADESVYELAESDMNIVILEAVADVVDGEVALDEPHYVDLIIDRMDYRVRDLLSAERSGSGKRGNQDFAMKWHEEHDGAFLQHGFEDQELVEMSPVYTDDGFDAVDDRDDFQGKIRKLSTNEQFAIMGAYDGIPMETLAERRGVTVAEVEGWRRKGIYWIRFEAALPPRPPRERRTKAARGRTFASC